jgi:prolyl-tRNA synthetase
MRIEIGPRDVEGNASVVYRRDRPHKEKTIVARAELVAHVLRTLEEQQNGLFQRAWDFRAKHTRVIDDYKELGKFLDEETGFALVHWDGTPESEARFKDDHKATIRCIAEAPAKGAPWDALDAGPGTCIVSGKPSARRVVVARSY